jgi:hypothetical protein
MSDAAAQRRIVPIALIAMEIIAGFPAWLYKVEPAMRAEMAF